MSNIIPFDFGDRVVRVHQDQDGGPWFVAKDVAAILDIQNIRQNLETLDDDEKGVYKAYTLGGEQEMSCVSESGLYSLIFRSRKPEAKKFRKWVTSEVLPALRKNGCYSMPEPSPAPVLPFDTANLPHLSKTQRSVALQSAVQVARMNSGDEDDIRRLFSEYCFLLARPSQPDVQLTESADIVGEFIESALTVSDHTRNLTPFEKTKASEVYQAFRVFCVEKKIPEHCILSQSSFGQDFKSRKGIHRVSPKNFVTYNVIIKENLESTGELDVLLLAEWANRFLKPSSRKPQLSQRQVVWATALYNHYCQCMYDQDCEPISIILWGRWMKTKLNFRYQKGARGWYFVEWKVVDAALFSIPFGEINRQWERYKTAS
ncbi:Bro-N domain-containing protein [Maridesulfovibrio ferrireducens]|uniref:BRO-N domain-containing protein n=1 Tax=Maridesulfovibrio ferrireducens TaxID=246191 RepID=UPI001A328B64|nr:Bro-N domain-containing protein [Maridesulfovibrio ferrireducens]MBI9109991.1 Bro-N domain-containing protein [Maridesulfovibrio ferrireducens]